jgi:hypothetical protein
MTISGYFQGRQDFTNNYFRLVLGAKEGAELASQVMLAILLGAGNSELL